MLSRSLLPLAALALAACSGAEPSSPSPEEAATATAAQTSVEDVKQYDACRADGHSGSLDLGQLNAAADPGTGATFETASCIVGRLSRFRGRSRPYNLQSFKNTPEGGQTFFFKRVSENTTHEAAPECLKIKLRAAVGPTDAFVTVERVKQLPTPRGRAACAPTAPRSDALRAP
jgi:hypothetical protein